MTQLLAGADHAKSSLGVSAKPGACAAECTRGLDDDFPVFDQQAVQPEDRFDRLWPEAQLIVTGGTGNTAWSK